MTQANPRSVPEIRDAVRLFEAWEANVRDPGAAARFTEAVQVLDDYLEAEPDTPHTSYVKNLKISNTRRLLQLLRRVDKSDVSSWMEYVNAVLLALKDEGEIVMARNPELKEDFQAFVAVWGQEYADALEQAIARNK